MANYHIFCSLGGMPEVVQTHGSTKVEKSLLSIASLLMGKECHKFQHKEVERGGKVLLEHKLGDANVRATACHVESTLNVHGIARDVDVADSTAKR